MSPLHFGQGAKALLFVFFSYFLLACATVPESDLIPVKSLNDDNEYRFITLENQLQVLLVSDPDTKKGAAALDVQVGSGDNPSGRAGLAHFLEHMLFLGTDKYPDAAEYEEFITEHGGSRNAYTSLENTNYFFDIDEAHLAEALDRFAQFFVAPKFDAQYVDREKNAVEAEYQMGLKSDGRRGLDVLQVVMNPEHPFSQFTVGSLDTLADRPGATIRDDLLAFYDKHYSANQMKLALLGSESLDELEAMVRAMFSAIPNKSFEYDEIAAPLLTPEDLPMLVQLTPQATMRELQVSFPIPDYRALYMAKPLSYLGNLVGHEGEGSLLSQLKSEGLAEGLGAGSGIAWRGGALFSVSVSLTELGAENYQRVLQLLFAYADMLRQRGPQERLYNEQARLAALSFRFREDAEPINYVSSVVSGMHYYSPRDVLRGPYMMNDYDEPMLIELFDALVPDNALVTFSDKLAVTDKVSNYYQVPYSSQRLDDQALQSWVSNENVAGLSLPTANDFIAENVALKPIAKNNPALPRVIFEENRQKIWFQQDSEFRIPKGATYINFRSSAVGQDATQTAALELYTALLKDSVNEFSYPASLAGLNFSLYKHAQGLSLRISGYNDKQQLLLDRLLQALQDSVFDQQRFTNIRQDMIRSLKNTAAQRPASQVIADLREALLYGQWGEEALISALETIDSDSLVQYSDQFWADARAEVMIYGNYDPQVVNKVANMVARLLPETPAEPLPNLQVLKLSAGESLQYVVDVPHDDSVVAWYLQGAGSTLTDRAAVTLAAQIMKSGFFQQLRTEQQLGYVASAFSWPQLDVPGLVMLIQSPSASAAEVATAMNAFLAATPAALTQEQFDRHKQAVINDILRPDKTLWDRAEFYWQSIARKHYEFASKQEMADAIDQFTLESAKAYFNDVLLAQPRSLQVVAPGRWNVLPDIKAAQFSDAQAIKAGHKVYSIE